MTSDRRRGRVGPGFRLAWAIVRQDPTAWLIALGLWLVFHGAPVVTGWALGQVLDSITDGADASATWAAIALLAGLEVVRWTVFLAAVVQWHGGWVAWHTRPRLALLDSLVSDPGPATGRLPGSSGEAVSRFRDDTEDVALVADVWLDVTAVAVSSLAAVVILATIDVRVAITVALPALIVMVVTHSMGPALRRWRRAAREATAEVTGFVGDTFGAIGAVKALGAERSVLTRFDALGHDRAREAARDEVGTQLLDSLSRSTADIGLAAALIVAAPVVAAGDISVGDLGVIAAYSTLLAGLPRFMGRLGAYHRQADVSAERLARLLPEDRRSLEAVAGPVDVRLRAPRHLPADASVGPVPGRDDPDLLPRDPADTVSRHPAHAASPRQGLDVQGLTVVHPGGEALRGVDLAVPPGSVLAVTGPVGSGKSSLLRAVLGLIPSTGAIRWDGEDARANPRLMVPPRVAYVPQVPRLFSEPLVRCGAPRPARRAPRCRPPPRLHGGRPGRHAPRRGDRGREPGRAVVRRAGAEGGRGTGAGPPAVAAGGRRPVLGPRRGHRGRPVGPHPDRGRPRRHRGAGGHPPTGGAGPCRRGRDPRRRPPGLTGRRPPGDDRRKATPSGRLARDGDGLAARCGGRW